ncbi:hypothetical protein RB195_005658 [Necator americanus]|uniref:Uncharacterized protein n=1 Tax=Necator americanus TaxID=51031 RepID=A0ABR1BP00_NECAM
MVVSCAANTPNERKYIISAHKRYLSECVHHRLSQHIVALCKGDDNSLEAPPAHRDSIKKGNTKEEKLTTAVEITKPKKPPDVPKKQKEQKLPALVDVKQKIFKFSPITKTEEKKKEPTKKHIPKLAPLQEKPQPKKGEKDISARSFHNTFLTEHFDNAEITNIIMPFKLLDFVQAFTTSVGPSADQRSTEEMRGDTLYKVKDDFPDLILPPLKNIDHTLPYLRELDVQATPACTPGRERPFGVRALKAFLNPLARTQAGTPVALSPAKPDKRLRTQSEEDSMEFVKPDRSRSKAVLSLPRVTPQNKLGPVEVSPREPEPAMVAQAAPQVATQQSKMVTQKKPTPSGRKRKGRTLRQHFQRLKNFVSGNKQPPEQQEKAPGT